MTYFRYARGERYLPQNIIPTVKHGGGNIKVWGAIDCHSGPGEIKKIEGTMDGPMYHGILVHQVMPHVKSTLNELPAEGIVVFQHNDPKHTAKKNLRYINSQVTALQPRFKVLP